MTDVMWLFVALAALYVAETCGWTSRNTVLFRNRMRVQYFPSRSWTLALPGRWFGNDNKGLHIRHLLPPLGSVFHCPVWPASLSPAGALAWVPFAMDRSERPDQSAEFFAWDAKSDQDSKPYAEDKSVFLHQNRLTQCATESHARHVLRLIDALHRAPGRKHRESIIDRAWTDAFNSQAIRESLRTFAAATALSRIIANLLFVHVFVVCPAVVYAFGLARTWLWLLLPVLALMVTSAIAFFNAHRRLQPKLTAERLTHTAMILLSPPAAIRSVDALARDQLVGFHPLAVAQVVMERDPFREFARRYVLDFRFALPSQMKATPKSRDTLQWHMRREAKFIRDFLASKQIGLEELTTSDPPADEGCASYCPRCQCQFVIPEGQCTMCDLPLVAFE